MWWRDYIHVAIKGIVAATVISGIYSWLANVQTLRILKEYSGNVDGLICEPTSYHFDGTAAFNDQQCDNMTKLMMSSWPYGWCYPQGECADGYMNVAIGNQDYWNLDCRLGGPCASIEYECQNDNTTYTIQSMTNNEVIWNMSVIKYNNYTSVSRNVGCSQHAHFADGLWSNHHFLKNIWFVLLVCVIFYAICAIIHDWTLLHYIKSNGSLNGLVLFPQSASEFPGTITDYKLNCIYFC